MIISCLLLLPDWSSRLVVCLSDFFFVAFCFGLVIVFFLGSASAVVSSEITVLDLVAFDVVAVSFVFLKKYQIAFIIYRTPCFIKLQFIVKRVHIIQHVFIVLCICIAVFIHSKHVLTAEYVIIMQWVYIFSSVYL